MIGGKKWEKGQSGNPKGRPKGVSNLREFVREFAAENTDDSKIDKTRLRIWLEIADRRARQGSVKHLELLLAYGYGRPVEKVELDVMTPEQRIERILEHLDGKPSDSSTIN
jgi:hypothetical protein